MAKEKKNTIYLKNKRRRLPTRILLGGGVFTCYQLEKVEQFFFLFFLKFLPFSLPFIRAFLFLRLKVRKNVRRQGDKTSKQNAIVL